MSLRPPSAAGVVAQIRDLLGLGGQDSAAVLPAQALEKLQRVTRERLLDWAARLGLTDLGQLTKDAIAGRIQAALRTVGVTGPEKPEPPLSSRKFDLGRSETEPPPPDDIPWGYGQDRITAMVVDPDRLYVYWEVTDEAIEGARAGLGAPDAWLNLRVYDVTGRIFDGTNAHGYRDQRVERTDRQWFVDVGKPSSTACVELGVKSDEGYFVRVARSGRADFPRREPAPPGEVEWLTVRVATGEMAAPPASAPSPFPSAESADAYPLPDRLVDIRETQVGADGEWIERRFEWSETRQGEWQEEVAHSSWEAGPFALPVDVPLRTVEEWHSTKTTVRAENGRTHVVYGPWQVVIRGLAGHAARRVVAVWEMRRSWIARAGTERLAAGASGRPGASERHWLGASEARLGGASELYRLGASELRLRGGSELRLGGASEYLYRGASERRAGGASEQHALPRR